MDLRLYISIFIAATCFEKARSACDVCPTGNCLRLHPTSYVDPKNPLDKVLTSLIGKRTLGLLYMPCWRGCLKFLGKTKSSNGYTYAKVDTRGKCKFQYMWTRMTQAKFSGHCGNNHHAHIAKTASTRYISTKITTSSTLPTTTTNTPSTQPPTTTTNTPSTQPPTTTNTPSTQPPTTTNAPSTQPTTTTNTSSTQSKTTTNTASTQATTTINSTSALPTTTMNRTLGKTSHPCDKFTLVGALMHHQREVNQNVGACADGTHSQSEAVIMNHCNASNTNTWSLGEQVMKHCSSIQMYTPVASFHNSGVFVGCTTNGFKMISQKCGGKLNVFNIDSSQNADKYFVVLW